MGLSANSHSASRRSPLPARALLFLVLGTAILSAAPAVAQFMPSPAKPSAYALRARSFLKGRTLSPPIAGAQSIMAAREQHIALITGSSLLPRIRDLNAVWQPLGPNQVASLAYGNVTGRVTAIAIDPADTSGNTVYLGTTGGGVWKSTNAAGPSASVSFTPLTDTLPVFSANAGTAVIPSLSIGAISVQSGVVLAGTGDPNDATDSFYGSGILRSIDGGLTWTIVQQSQDGAAGDHSFTGLGFAGFAWSSTSPDTVVAAVSQAAEGNVVNAVDTTYSVMGLYYSTDAGATWQMATIMDSGQFVQRPLPGDSGGNNAATSVVWNPIRQRFYAAIRYHGYYESPDGATWTRLANQPGASLSLTACPSNAGGVGSTSCPIFRGALAVQPVTGDTFALTVDGSNVDQGLWQDVCGLTGTSCTSNTVTFAKQLPSAPLETGNGNAVIPQADYNLALAAMPSGADTLLFAGTVDLYRCSLTGGCSLRNTTNAINGCAAPAMVAPAQHAIATVANSTVLYLGNDGGLWRSTDGVNQQATPCSSDDATHFQNLNGGLGSLAEVTSFAQHPSDPATLLVGLGANGTAATSTASTSLQSPPWAQLATGEGGTVAIDQTNPELWYLSNGAGVSIHQCTSGASCTPADFTGIPTIGPTQTAQDASLIDAPWLLDPALPSNILIGTCRVWRGPADSGAAWSSANTISKLLSGSQNSACNASNPVLRSLAAAGPVSSGTAAQNAGSKVLYAGMAGKLDGGGTSGGHLFSTSSADMADGATAWTDLTSSPVTNDLTPFNPGGFDISSLAADSHDPTGKTLYATVMGFAGNGSNAPHLYRSIDGGASWSNISNNLPNAPANSVIVDPNDANTVYVALDTGVYVTTQVAACASPLNNCWSIYGTSLPNSPVIQLAAAPAMPTGDGRIGELRAATYGRGLWQIPLLTALNPAEPAIALSPASLTFSDQAVATASSPQTITVTNSGSAPLVITEISTTGDFATDDTNDTCAAAPIAAGQTCTVQVRFLPTATGSRSGFLIVYGNVPGGQATATLGGTGTPPATVVLNPIDITFPPTNINATSLAQNITISNTGGTTTTLQTPTVSGAGFVISANTCTSTLKADTGCTVAITFTPTASGAYTGSFSITDGVGTQTASLSGMGTTPATDALSSNTLTFATQQLTTVSAPQQITLTNSGDVALTLISAQIPGSDFTVANACGNSLNPHSTCAIDVAFQPQSIGPVTAQLTIADQYRTQTVALSGTGVAPPGVSLSPLYNLAFPSTGVGQTSAPQTVTLTNNGGLPLALSSTALSGDFSILPGSDTCGTTLPVANACTLQLVFSPTTGGTRTGTLTITDSAPRSPQVLHLTGSAVDFALTSDGDTTVTIASGQNAVFPLLFTSATALPTTFTCAGTPLNAICNITPSSIAVSGATTVSVTLLTGTLTASLVPPGQNMALWLGALLPLGLLTLRRGCLPRLACALLLCALIFFPTGCGTGRQLPSSGSAGSSPGQTPVTPAGTYPIVVSATSNGLTHTISLTLIVR
ncbi:choice-of-anchor D domain-containing protein [Edaphobacter paludis]|uniref:Choice-of-anchor D domain-containing protein n=1 Tax=Edaphobacter paludis TaxID=3035702 RepID=A0AAU7DA79_9BACT